MSRNPPPSQSSNNTNNGRNEYIPQYISAKPFYAEDLLKNEEYLSHQRSKAEQKDTIDKAKWYERGRKSGPAATKYRKGACENCGAMTHKTKECLSRPRKHGAKWSGKDIQADEIVDDVNLGWDAKRDRWNGYDVREYDTVVKDYEDMETLRKVAGSKSSTNGEGEPKDGEAEGNDGDHYAEETDMGRNQPTSTRQLRLREDTAKYLVNLDLDSAKYDPKTRSMDTTAQSLNNHNNSTSTDLASEGFTRPSHDPASDAAAFEKAQRYAWETQEKPTSTPSSTSHQQEQSNSKVHLEANPTASALAHKQHQVAAAAKKDQQQAYLLSKYGDTSASTSVTSQLKKPPASIASSSAYVTYDPKTGAVLDAATGKPLLKPVPKSKYPEDIYPGNHSSVFGSWWRNGKWGYRCCHSFVRNSYCTGEDGIRGFEEEEAQRLGRNLIGNSKIETENADGSVITENEAMDTKKRKALEGERFEDDDRAKRNKTEEPS